MKSHSWHYLDLRTLGPLIGLILFQQALNAFGTYALVKAGFSIQAYSVFIFWVAMALAVHVLSPLLGIIIRPLETKTTFKAYQKFLDEKLLAKSLRPALWAQKSRREVFLASIGSETDSYLGAIIFVGLDVFSYILSLVFGVLVLGVTVDTALIPAFLLAGALSFTAFQVLEKKVTGASQDEQEARTNFASFLLLSWENIFFKNKALVKSYHRDFRSHFESSQQKAIRATCWSEGLVAILSTLSALPVVAALLLIAQKDSAAPAILTALLVTIPRQLNLLTTFRSIFQSMTSFISFEAKFTSLDRNAELNCEDLEKRILIDEIAIQGNDFKDLPEAVAALQETKRGRILIQGKNGVGKSTLLLHFNEALANSLYLPANPQFNLEKTKFNESTGEKLVRHIRYIANTDATHILLDEWDANLDDKNIQLVDKILDEMSATKVVVEVRHRVNGALTSKPSNSNILR